jgi:transposase
MKMQPQEIRDEDHELVIERVCAIDVAKASGKVCVRVPHPSRGGRRISRVWDVEATTGVMTELAEWRSPFLADVPAGDQAAH